MSIKKYRKPRQRPDTRKFSVLLPENLCQQVDQYAQERMISSNSYYREVILADAKQRFGYSITNEHSAA